MKWILFLQEAILVNCSRGPVIDEVALVEHLKQNPMFRVGLDVFEVTLRTFKSRVNHMKTILNLVHNC